MNKKEINLKQDILKNAIDLFYENGYKKTTMRSISDANSVTHVAIYWHYKNKEDLGAEVIRRYLSRLYDISMNFNRQHPAESMLIFYWALHFYLNIRDKKFAHFFLDYCSNAGEAFMDVVYEFSDTILKNIFRYKDTEIKKGIDFQALSKIGIILLQSCIDETCGITFAAKYICDFIGSINHDEVCITEEQIARFIRDNIESIGFNELDIKRDFLSIEATPVLPEG